MAGFLSRFVTSCALLLILADASAAQNNNFIHFSQTHLPLPRIRQYTDCWGYRDDVTGKEYAILGSVEGISIWNITDPFNPYQTGFFFGAVQSVYRDVEVFDKHIYGVSQGPTSGMQIIDITNPEAPVSRPTFGSFTARNFHIDAATSTGYAIGWHPTVESAPKSDQSGAEMLSAARGFHAWDLSSPESPDSLGVFVFPYFHDATIRNGKFYGGAINEFGRLDIIRVSDLPATNTVASVTYPSGQSHGTALSDNSAYCYVADELPSNGTVRVFDVSDTSDVLQVASFPPVAGTSVHNISTLRDTVYCAWYEAGVRMFDCTNPESPVLIGTWDTGPDTAAVVAGYTGCWGVYPKLPSGVVIASDILQGFVLLYHSELSGTVSGTVTDFITGMPISAAQVAVPAFFNARSTTNGAGNYTRILPGGTHTVIATKTGYLPDTLSVDILDGQTTALNIQLIPLSATGLTPGGAVANLVLADPSPNPARESSTLAFELPRAGAVSLILYDTSGRRVRTIASGAFPVGRHSLRWDGRDDAGRAVASGAFVARLEAAGEVRSTKLLLSR
ncbi:MAG: choice-of-anchor B family protein [bacterium]